MNLLSAAALDRSMVLQCTTTKKYPKKTLASRGNRERSADAKFVDDALKSGIF